MRQLRSFHNWIKSELVASACKHFRDNYGERARITLLDFGCGKGNDQFKWKKHRVEFALGLDPDLNSIREAYERGKQQVPPTYVFLCEPDPLGYVHSQVPPESVDIFSCMFAVHYLTRDDLELLLRNVQRVLVPGGLALLTHLDGTAVLSTGLPIRDRHFTIEPEDPRRVRVSIRGTQYFDSVGSSVEHLVFPGHIRQIAQANDLVVVESLSKPFGAWSSDPLSKGMTDSERALSNLHCSGVLFKPFKN